MNVPDGNPANHLRRRNRRVLAIVAAALVVALVIIGVVLVNRPDATPQPAPSTTASMQQAFLDNVSDSLSVAGGAWTFENKTTPFSLARARTHTPVECLSDSTTEQYDLALYGDPPEDPRTAARALADHWTERGFKVTTVVDNADGIELRADTPDGSLLDYAASTSLSSLVFQSACVKSVG